ncbi:hypothetical protein GF359_08845 [candidate division WOR-3 bacterium]|uniref:Bulb-type lectin domain-containing protein n=1 Tax=candidate division WOR-3 bacterium TaxID=2052148 RepID=A0A9D5QDP9_UNCW3|nr:hypothetical protein [candidate division WOR-3 bacterium]MBD3365307.1 hypothetical protein [candidate division WOR-3 bacterium]
MVNLRTRQIWGVTIVVGILLCTSCKKESQSEEVIVENPDSTHVTLETPTSWEKSFGTGYLDIGNCVRQTADGGYVIVGYTFSFEEGGDVYLIKTDANGKVLWHKTYDGDGLGNFVEITNDGGFIIAGSTISSDDSDDRDCYLIRTDSRGDTLWTRTYEGFYINSVVHDPDGGYIFSRGFGDTVSVMNIDEEGNTVWERTYPWIDRCSNTLYRTADEGFIIAGLYYGDSSLVQLLKTNSQGDTLWRRYYKAFYASHDAFCTASESGYFLAGEGNDGIWIMKMDEAGDSLWTRYLGEKKRMPYMDCILSLRKTSDGGYILAGGKDLVYNCDVATEGSLLLIKIDANGDTLWSREYGGEGGQVGNFVQETSDGGYIVVGVTTTPDGSNTDIYLVKTEPMRRK